MELYFLRHGIAADVGPDGSGDAGRPLTAKGIAKLKEEARGLRRLGVRPDIVLTSPLVRARQTADAVAGTFDPRPPIVVIESLSPGGTYQAVLADLEKQTRRSRIALVGHEPGIGELAARMIGSRHALEFKKGAVCLIYFETLPPAGPGALRWFLTPAILRTLRK